MAKKKRRGMRGTAGRVGTVLGMASFYGLGGALAGAVAVGSDRGSILEEGTSVLEAHRARGAGRGLFIGSVFGAGLGAGWVAMRSRGTTQALWGLGAAAAFGWLGYTAWHVWRERTESRDGGAGPVLVEGDATALPTESETVPVSELEQQVAAASQGTVSGIGNVYQLRGRRIARR